MRILYRDRLQFSGWQEGEGSTRLSKEVAIILLVLSVILLILPVLIDL